MTAATPSITLQPIGIIRSPYHAAAGTPIQPAYTEGSEGEVIVDSSFEPALADLEGFERIWLLYWFDRAGAFRPRVIPYRDTREHGVLATRAPCRPNRIGISVVHLLARTHNVLRVRGLDVLDRTPLLDIKPYVPKFDAYPTSQAGWLEVAGEDRRSADGRFDHCDGARKDPSAR